MKRMVVACVLMIGCWMFPVGLVAGETEKTPRAEVQMVSEDVREQEASEPQDTEAPSQPEPLLDICLVLDNSGSMKKNDPQYLTKEVVKNFVNGLGETSHLGMVVFDQEASLVESLGSLADDTSKETFLSALSRVDYQGQFTNSPAAIERAIYELKTNGRVDAEKVIIFLTDGIIDTGDKTQDVEKEKWLKEDLAQESSKAGVRIFGIAFTDNADFLLIQTLAIKTEGEYFRAYKAEDIQGVFEKINTTITEPPAIPEKPALPTPQPEKVMKSQMEPVPAPVPAPVPQKEGIPVPLAIAAIIVIVGIIVLILLLKGKSRKERPPVAGGTSGGRIVPKDPSIPRVELIDTKKEVFKEPMILEEAMTIIGRESHDEIETSHNDIVIPKDTVSAYHAEIKYETGQFFLVDTRSSNGTMLNNTKIEVEKPYRLKSGDLIKFDVYEFRFHVPGQAPRGGTVLSSGRNEVQSSGTILRPSKVSDESSPIEVKPAPKENEKPPEDENQPASKPTEESEGTKLKQSMCPNHSARRATELCSVCKKAFCKTCVTEKDGKTVCVDCTKKASIS